MWIDGAKSVKQAGGRVPNGEVWGRAIRRMQLFDNLVGNPDRNAGNILLGAPGELILIDHSRAFVIDQKLPFAFERVDQTLWERVCGADETDLASHLGPWIGGEAVDAILQRRDTMADEVGRLVKKRGRALVIIP